MYACVCVCVRRTFSISRLCRSIRNNYITGAYQSRRWTRQLVKGDTFGVSPISVQAPVFSLPFRETSFIPNVRFSDSSCLSVSRKLPAFFHELTDTLLRVRRNRGYTRERERYRYEDIATWKCNAARANALDPKKNSPAHRAVEEPRQNRKDGK